MTQIITFLLFLFSTLIFASDDVAVVIGNKNYKSKDIPQVEYAHRDAQAIKNWLIKTKGFDEENIIDLRDATQADFNALFGNADDPEGNISHYIDLDGNSRLIVYYSGHGMPAKNGRSYIMPVDANANKPHLNGYPLDLLYKNLASLNTKSTQVILESCFSGGSGAGMLIKGASPITFAPKLPKAEGLTVFTAASGKQFASWDNENQHGIFTYQFLKGITGKADKNNDNQVSTKEMANYLRKSVRRVAGRVYGRKQTPEIRGKRDGIISPVDNNVLAQISLVNIASNKTQIFNNNDLDNVFAQLEQQQKQQQYLVNKMQNQFNKIKSFVIADSQKAILWYKFLTNNNYQTLWQQGKQKQLKTDVIAQFTNVIDNLPRNLQSKPLVQEVKQARQAKQARLEQARQEQARLEQAKQARLEQARQEQARLEQARQEQAKQARLEQARLEQARQAKQAELERKAKSYLNNSNGTVTDKRTGLMWMRCSLGQIWTGSTCSGSAKGYTWNNAKNLSTSFAGYDDWRTPSIAELNTLVYCSNGKQLKYKEQGYDTIKHEGSYTCKSNTRGGYQSPTINQTAFPNTPATYFWSSSPDADYSSRAWLLYFNFGADYNSYRDNSDRVRLVRSGE